MGIIDLEKMRVRDLIVYYLRKEKKDLINYLASDPSQIEKGLELILS
jgi:hypothetical protein